MINISGFGLKMYVVALETFPLGFELSHFPDDADALTFHDYEANGFQMEYDGTPFFFEKSSPVTLDVSVLPNTTDDTNLRMLLSMKKSQKSWLPFSDVTTMAITYPDGGIIALSSGCIVSGAIGDAIKQSGRKSSNTYRFVFGTIANMQSVEQSILTGAQGALSLL